MEKHEGTQHNGRRGVEAVKEFARVIRWSPEVIEEADDYCAYRVRFGTDFPVVGARLEVFTDQQQFVFYLDFEPAVPVEGRAAVCEFLTRANHGMKIGNFEMNWADGKVRYKTSVDFQATDLTPRLVGNQVAAAFDSTKPYVAALLGVVEGRQNAREAIASAEG